MFADHHHPTQEHYLLDLTQEAPAITDGLLRLGGTNPQGETLAFTNYYLTRNGRPTIPVMGEFHFSRFPRQYWEQELRKMQAGGVTVVASYIFWIHVEEEEGIFDWSGNNDLRTFVATCQALQMPVVIRIGPFAHGECRNGGLPDWIYGRGIAARSNDERYLRYVRRLYQEIANQVKGLLFADGGVVIGIQLDNEYMHCGAPWEPPYRSGSEWVPAGSEGDAHMLRLKQIAQEAGLLAPIYTCTAWLGSPVPEGEFLPMQGGYAFTPWVPDPLFRQEPTEEFLFRNRHLQPLAQGEATYEAWQYPYACCELGGGTQITYNHRPTIPPQCVQAMAIIALAGGANWLGYYMYHGGSNPVGKRSYLNEHTVPRISYDFQAPVREFGQLNQSYHYLRTLHLFLLEFGELLAPMTVMLPEHNAEIRPQSTDRLRYAARSRDGAGFLFLNNYQDHVALPERRGIHLQLDLPGESLTLPHQPEGLTLRPDMSAILPFNLQLEQGVRLKYATAQLLTQLHAAELTTYVFFAPEGLVAELALDRATYRHIEITHGSILEQEELGYITIEAGREGRIHITSANGELVQLLVLTQEQAHACWKVSLGGEERLLLSPALVLEQQNDLHLTWRGSSTTSLVIYPPLPEAPVPGSGSLSRENWGIFTRYHLEVPEHRIDLALQESTPDVLRIGLPATALEGIEDAYLHIDYLGDTGQAYLDGRLISDHFANGLPWEIGLKRFVEPGRERELILHISPLQQNAPTLNYFPTGMAFRPITDGSAVSEIRSITALPEYHLTLSLPSA